MGNTHVLVSPRRIMSRSVARTKSLNVSETVTCALVTSASAAPTMLVVAEPTGSSPMAMVAVMSRSVATVRAPVVLGA